MQHQSFECMLIPFQKVYQVKQKQPLQVQIFPIELHFTETVTAGTVLVLRSVVCINLYIINDQHICTCKITSHLILPENQ